MSNADWPAGYERWPHDRPWIKVERLDSPQMPTVWVAIDTDRWGENWTLVGVYATEELARTDVAKGQPLTIVTIIETNIESNPGGARPPRPPTEELTMTETTPEPWHGTINGYYVKHCRCADCREAIRVHYHEVVKKDPPKPCQADGCPKMAAPRRKWCHGHCRRMTKTGSVDGPAIRTFGGDDASYEAAHKRVHYAKGKARKYSCSRCGGPAKDWAYIHGSPGEVPAGVSPKTGRYHGPYSPNPDDYQPMCAPCHKDYDLERAGKAATRCPSCGQRVRAA